MGTARKDKATVVLSPSPDNDAASQQLLTESQSQSPVASHANPAPSRLQSSVASANLLNAARASTVRRATGEPPVPTQRRSAATPPKGTKAGKLKRPSFAPGNLEKVELRGPRSRPDVYDHPESPEKTRYRLPQETNHRTLKVVKRKGKPKSKDLYVAPTLEPSAPSGSAHDEEDSIEIEVQGRRKSGRLAGEDANIDHVQWEKDPESLPSAPRRSKRKVVEHERERPGKIPQRHSVRSQFDEANAASGTRNTKSQPRVLIRPREETHVLPVGNEKPNRGQATKRSRKPSATREKPLQSQPRLENGATNLESTGLGNQSKLNALRTAAPLHAGERITKGTEDQQIFDGPYESDEEEDTLFVPDVPAQLSKTLKGTGVTRPTSSAMRKPAGSEQQSRRSASGSTPIGINKQQAGTEYDANDADNEEQSRTNSGDKPQFFPFQRVFSFLDDGERNGVCSSDACNKIAQKCNVACATIELEDLSASDIRNLCTTLQEALANVRLHTEEDDLRDVKVDVFAYIFHSLARVIKAIHNWAEQEYEGGLLKSLPAIRIMQSLIKDILHLKDTASSWDVRIPNRFQGEQLLKTINNTFIAPLRKADAHLHTRLIALQRLEESAKARQQANLEQQQVAEQLRRQVQATAQIEKRRAHWQHLHIQRQLCEPSTANMARRAHLFLQPDSFHHHPEERDANGDVFEREPIFRERSTPFAHRTQSFNGVKWSDEQTEALIAGLEKFAGPRVFEKIFDKYCRYGGPLRDFNVVEITGEAAAFRSEMRELCQGKGWEVPAWIEGIPVLP